MICFLPFWKKARRIRVTGSQFTVNNKNIRLEAYNFSRNHRGLNFLASVREVRKSKNKHPENPVNPVE
jgi:hypothetical protein